MNELGLLIGGVLAYGIGFGLPAFAIVALILHFGSIQKNFKIHAKACVTTFVFVGLVNTLFPSAPGAASLFVAIIIPIGSALGFELLFRTTTRNESQ